MNPEILPSPSRDYARERVSAQNRQALRLGQLIDARNTGETAKEVVIIAHALILCTLPYSPTDEHFVVRKARLGDGSTLTVTFSKGIEDVPLPFGSDRKLLVWILDRAYRQKSREISWESAREYQREMGLSHGGKGNRNLQASFRRLAGLNINIERVNGTSAWGKNRSIIEDYFLPSSIRGVDDTDQMCLNGIPAHRDYQVRINESLFEEMAAFHYAIPRLLWNQSKLLDSPKGKRGLAGARAHDLLIFLFIRCFAARSESPIPWAALAEQVSSDSNPWRLKAQTCEAIKFLKHFWPGCQIEPIAIGVLINTATAPPHPDDFSVNRYRKI
jgi:Plasmid encoded RepA protein